MKSKILGNLIKVVIPDVEERISEKINNSNNSNLTDREVEILNLRIFDGKTLAEIGNKFGVTRERIRQIEARAFRKLRRPEIQFFDILKDKDFGCYKNVINDMINLIQSEISKEESDSLEKIKIEDLDFNQRVYYILKRNGIDNLKELQELSKEELQTFKNLGEKGLKEVVEKVENIPFFKFKKNVEIKVKKLNYIGKKRIEKGITKSKYAELTKQYHPDVSSKELLELNKLQLKDIILAMGILDLDINELIDICKEEMNIK